MGGSWRHKVWATEERLRGRITELTCDIDRGPVDLHALARKLDAHIQRCSSKQDGRLQRSRDGWIVAVKREPTPGRQPGETPRERFTIAHELAHIMFIEAGLDTPVTRGGYWILEQACHRVACDLLVPVHLGPKGHLTGADLRGWMLGLTQTWNLSPEAAAKCIAQRSANVRSVAGLDVDGWGDAEASRIAKITVKWSLSVCGQDSWPNPYTLVRGPRFPEFRQLVGEHVHLLDNVKRDTRGRLSGDMDRKVSRWYITKIDALGGALIGFWFRDWFVIFRQDRDYVEQMKLL